MAIPRTTHERIMQNTRDANEEYRREIAECRRRIARYEELITSNEAWLAKADSMEVEEG